jgi:Protein of unknown function (DUF2568)
LYHRSAIRRNERGASSGSVGIVDGLRATILTVRFLCEVGLLAGLAYWGFTVGEGATAWLLGIGAPAVAAVVWGLFVAPKAKVPVSMPIRLSIELDLSILVAVALWFSGAPASGLLVGVLGATTSALNALTENRAAL